MSKEGKTSAVRVKTMLRNDDERPADNPMEASIYGPGIITYALLAAGVVRQINSLLIRARLE
jgi:hypothetical protein